MGGRGAGGGKSVSEMSARGQHLHRLAFLRQQKKEDEAYRREITPKVEANYKRIASTLTPTKRKYARAYADYVLGKTTEPPARPKNMKPLEADSITIKIRP